MNGSDSRKPSALESDASVRGVCDAGVAEPSLAGGEGVKESTRLYGSLDEDSSEEGRSEARESGLRSAAEDAAGGVSKVCIRERICWKEVDW